MRGKIRPVAALGDPHGISRRISFFLRASGIGQRIALAGEDHIGAVAAAVGQNFQRVETVVGQCTVAGARRIGANAADVTKLPESERVDWEALWKFVVELLAKAPTENNSGHTP